MKTTTRALKTWSKRNIPEDLWPEILSRLPVKSLLRFRSVCRSWRTFIDNPDFAQLHLTRFNNNIHQSHLFSLQGTSRRTECVVKHSTTLRTTASLGFLDSHLPESYILCSTDGLLLLIRAIGKTSLDLVLWNPSIRKTLTLPPPPEICNGAKMFEFGLGFDSLIQDYKFVRFVLESNAVTSGVLSVAIYTIGTRSWKTIGFQGEGCSGWREDLIANGERDYKQTTLCLRGVLYALARNQSQTPIKLVSFGLSSELFASSALPEVDNLDVFYEDLTMADGGCSLAMVYMGRYEGYIWVLESLGNDVESSWTPRYTFATLLPDYVRCVWDIRFVYLNKNVELLLKWKNSLLAINLETKKEKIILKKKLHRGKTWPYVESLLLL